MIVEDNPANLMLAGAVLRRGGATLSLLSPGRLAYDADDLATASPTGEPDEFHAVIIASGDTSPDLTRLAVTMGDRFSHQYVLDVITGTREYPAHGPRDMPVWQDRLADVDSGTEAAGALYRIRMPEIAMDKRRNKLRFYRDLLGLPIVHDGPSDDDPNTRHVWFGALHGGAGMLLSFMQYPELPKGTVGIGSTHHFALIVDSAVIARAPARFLVAGIGDALSTWFEARSNLESRSGNLVQPKLPAPAAGIAIAAHVVERTAHRQPITPLSPEIWIALALVAWAILTLPLSV